MYSTTSNGTAVSEAARQLQHAASDALGAFERSQALFGKKSAAIEEIWRLAGECREAGWDGYGAKPVGRDAVRRAISIIRGAPGDLPIPEVAIEPDGSIALEWSRSRHSILSLRIGSENGLAYAWLDGVERGHAVAGYDEGTFPLRVLHQIRLIFAGDDAPVGAA
jgi:hypothetical protein